MSAATLRELYFAEVLLWVANCILLIARKHDDEVGNCAGVDCEGKGRHPRDPTNCHFNFNRVHPNIVFTLRCD